MSVLERGDLAAVQPNAVLSGVSKAKKKSKDDTHSGPVDGLSGLNSYEDSEDGIKDCHGYCPVLENRSSTDPFNGKS